MFLKLKFCFLAFLIKRIMSGRGKGRLGLGNKKTNKKKKIIKKRKLIQDEDEDNIPLAFLYRHLVAEKFLPEKKNEHYITSFKNCSNPLCCNHSRISNSCKKRYFPGYDMQPTEINWKGNVFFIFGYNTEKYLDCCKIDLGVLCNLLSDWIVSLNITNDVFVDMRPKMFCNDSMDSWDEMSYIEFVASDVKSDTIQKAKLEGIPLPVKALPVSSTYITLTTRYDGNFLEDSSFVFNALLHDRGGEGDAEGKSITLRYGDKTYTLC